MLSGGMVDSATSKAANARGTRLRRQGRQRTSCFKTALRAAACARSKMKRPPFQVTAMMLLRPTPIGRSVLSPRHSFSLRTASLGGRLGCLREVGDFDELYLHQLYVMAELDNAQQPQDQDQDQQTAKTDIHNILPFRVATETVGPGQAFQSLRLRHGSHDGIILPVRKSPVFLDFLPFSRK